MVIRRIFGLVVLAAVLLLPPTSPRLTPDAAPAEYPFDLEEVVERSAAKLLPVRGPIDVAVTSAYEYAPQVAVCASNQYLVVFEYVAAAGERLNIYGQRLTSSGDLLGQPFEIDDQSFNTLAPDVACDWSHDRFVVVWQYDFEGNSADFDVFARAVHGSHQASGSQLAGPTVPVSWDGSGIDEVEPAIACNSDDGSCLVVFQYATGGSLDDNDVYGQRLSVGSGSLPTDGERFGIGQAPTADLYPDVAWGPLDGNYLVAWRYDDSTHAHDSILYCLVYDTEQGLGANEVQGGPWYLIDPSQWSLQQVEPAVAYNGRAGGPGRYLVVFTYDWEDIAARRIRGSDGAPAGEPFFLAQTTDRAEQVAVAASGGPEGFADGASADQFLVTYVVTASPTDSRLYAQAVKGTHAAAGDQLEGLPLELARADEWDLVQGGITGSAHNGRYAIVWEDLWDVYGQILAPYGVYLPLLVNSY